MKCQSISLKQWNSRSNVLLDWLKKQDAGQWWKAEAAAEKVGDDVILQQINAEEAAEIEHEHIIVPDSEVDDHVAENVLIDLPLKDSYRHLIS